MGLDERDYYRDDGRGGFRLAIPRTVVMNLIVVNVAVFLVCWFTGPNSQALGSEISKLLELTPAHPWQVWRFLTYGFAHKDIWHVLFNMYGLFLFGRDVEGRYGKWEFLRVYLAMIVFGGLVWLGGSYAVSTVSERSFEMFPAVVGASGAVVGVTILFCMNFPRRELLVMGVLPVQAWVLGLVYVGFDLVSAFSAAFGRRGDIAFQVHLAGAAFAAAYFLLGWNFGALGPSRGTNPRRWFQRKPRLRVHSAADEARPAPRRAPPPADDANEDLDRRADEVLRKLHESGEESLSAKERRVLEEYSRRMRKKHR